MDKRSGRRHRPTWAEIDLDRVKQNYLNLKSLLPGDSFFCPMVKANAYGHGAIEVSRALRDAGAGHLGVSLVEEGLQLRAVGDSSPLLVFGVFEGAESTKAVIDARLTPVVSEWQQLEELDRALGSANSLGSVNPLGSGAFPIHLKMNTGMNRLGFRPSEARALRSWLDQHPRLRLDGICTHLLRGDDAGSPTGESAEQFRQLKKCLAPFGDLNVSIHALNSSGLLNLSSRVSRKKSLSADCEWPYGARPGIGIYGIAPTNDEGVDIGLQPVMKLVSHLVETRKVKAGEAVSYGATWRATRDSLIGVVAAGYADGVWRSVSNQASVLCRGRRAPIAGIVCMDFFMIDLTELQASVEAMNGVPIERGEEIVIFGEQDPSASGSQGRASLSATELGTMAGTISYEILTRVTDRVPRFYRGS